MATDAGNSSLNSTTTVRFTSNLIRILCAVYFKENNYWQPCLLLQYMLQYNMAYITLHDVIWQLWRHIRDQLLILINLAIIQHCGCNVTRNHSYGFMTSRIREAVLKKKYRKHIEEKIFLTTNRSPLLYRMSTTALLNSLPVSSWCIKNIVSRHVTILSLFILWFCVS